MNIKKQCSQTARYKAHISYLVEPVVLQALFGDVLARDDARDAVVAVQHHQVPQPHRAEKSTGRSQTMCQATPTKAVEAPGHADDTVQRQSHAQQTCRTYLKQRWIEELALMVYGEVSM
jgi:hypothetical protein